jgi:hypothetical protein
MKQKLLTLALLLCACLQTWADEWTDSNGVTWTYTLNGSNADIIGSSKTSGSLDIPNKVNGYTVTGIGGYAFQRGTGLTSVTIPEGVTGMGGWVFEGCSGLTSVTFPSSVTSIGDEAFAYCLGLTTVTIPNSVTSIGYKAFSQTAWYNSQPDGLVYAGKVAYKYKGIMPENTSISLEEGTLGIAVGAFYECSGLTSVTIPNSVTNIGIGAFYGCDGLTSVTIPNSVTSIGERTFYNCSGLTSVTIPNSVTSIGDEAFSGCSGLTDVFCYAVYVPTTYADVFNNSSISTATLHVPAPSLTSYRTTAPWSDFKTFVALDGETPPVPEICATPTIAFANGKLTFACETEGASFVSSLSFEDASLHTSSEVSLAAKYRISVYAKKDGYANSVVATMDIDLATMGDANGDGQITIIDAIKIVNVILEATSTEPRSGLGTIVTLDGETPSAHAKCATPTISLANGMLTFTSETEGASFVTSLSFADASLHNSSEVSLATKYRFSVYAKKDGYANSDVATIDIDLATRGDANGDGKITIADAVKVVDVILEGGDSSNSARLDF